jgi:hypothetical protein
MDALVKDAPSVVYTTCMEKAAEAAFGGWPNVAA